MPNATLGEGVPLHLQCSEDLLEFGKSVLHCFGCAGKFQIIWMLREDSDEPSTVVSHAHIGAKLA
eukprot:10381656-Lingulodinium_polyedra.AAC.1